MESAKSLDELQNFNFKIKKYLMMLKISFPLWERIILSFMYVTQNKVLIITNSFWLSVRGIRRLETSRKT